MIQTSPWTGQVAGWNFDQVTGFHVRMGDRSSIWDFAEVVSDLVFRL